MPPPKLSAPSAMHNANHTIHETVITCSKSYCIVDFRPKFNIRENDQYHNDGVISPNIDILNFGFDWLRNENDIIYPFERSYISFNSKLPFMSNNSYSGLVQSGYDEDKWKEKNINQSKLENLKETLSLIIKEQPTDNIVDIKQKFEKCNLRDLINDFPEIERIRGAESIEGIREEINNLIKKIYYSDGYNAQNKLKKEYENFRINDNNYYIPYLNIYPGKYADLQLLIRKHGNTVPMRIEFDYEKKFLGIEILEHGFQGDRLSPFNAFEENVHYTSRSQGKLEYVYKGNPTLTIIDHLKDFQLLDRPYMPEHRACTIKQLIQMNNNDILNLRITSVNSFNIKQYIEVYAIYENNRQLAGKLCILPNNKTFQKKINIQRVNVNINGFIAKEDDFIAEENNNLKKILNHALIEPNFLAETKTIIIPDNNALATGFHLEGKQIIFDDRSKFCNYLTAQLRKTNKNTIYLFVFDKENERRSVGHAFVDNNQDFQNGLAIYSNRTEKTLSHEALHTLQLYHTHEDQPPIIKKNIKYLFPKDTIDVQDEDDRFNANNSLNATTNIMSYNHNRRCTTWHWQWEIMRSSPLLISGQ